MLDIGFTELLLVAIIALVVLGPKRLPEAIRVSIYWAGKLRRSFQSMKEELEREIGADEIKQQLYNEAIMKEHSKDHDQIQHEEKGFVVGDKQGFSQLNAVTESTKESNVITDHQCDLTPCNQPGKNKL
ncbi:MAG: Sec-independent protein translocase protein TatB [Candidatus Endonucleobacter bathymodioli]|uniref:Sec-independent protein translocase protein TatB n=1 Tax=Candidatus Endonucleibacter bathymodioli TaxID=539814 RepID=A0AA90NPQ8_9GAMM|nr:Sec-independent protein translocase protein TatB [Candidatus Endonucleobacter bathymodioli]